MNTKRAFREWKAHQFGGRSRLRPGDRSFFFASASTRCRREETHDRNETSCSGMPDRCHCHRTPGSERRRPDSERIGQCRSRRWSKQHRDERLQGHHLPRVIFVDDSDDDTPAIDRDGRTRTGPRPAPDRAPPSAAIVRAGSAGRSSTASPRRAASGSASSTATCSTRPMIAALLDARRRRRRRPRRRDPLPRRRLDRRPRGSGRGDLPPATARPGDVPARPARPQRSDERFLPGRRDRVDPDTLRPLGFKILLEIVVRHPDLRIAEVPFTFGARYGATARPRRGEGLDFARQLRRLCGERPSQAGAPASLRHPRDRHRRVRRAAPRARAVPRRALAAEPDDPVGRGLRRSAPGRAVDLTADVPDACRYSERTGWHRLRGRHPRRGSTVEVLAARCPRSPHVLYTNLVEPHPALAFRRLRLRARARRRASPTATTPSWSRRAPTPARRRRC